jgi:hypothetical protein
MRPTVRSPGALNFSASETVCFDVKPQIIIVRFSSRPPPMRNQANTPGEAVTQTDSFEAVVENNGGEWQKPLEAVMKIAHTPTK